MSSAKSKGKTIWEIISEKFNRDITPLEFQYHNPLSAKVGNTMSFSNLPEYEGINFVIEKISVPETRIGDKKFYHTDYILKGISLDMDYPLRIRLRVIPDENSFNKLGCRLQLLKVCDEFEFDEGFYSVVTDPCKEFSINQDDQGNELELPLIYRRVEDVADPYHARVTVLCDKDNDGTVDKEELDRYNITYWDYHRQYIDQDSQTKVDFLNVEMNDKSRYFTLMRGFEVDPSQIMVI